MSDVEILKNQPVQKYTFYGIGGSIDEVWNIKNLDALPEIWAECQAEKIPTFLLGKGSNTCFSDAGFRGRVIRILADETTWQGNYITIEAGKNMQKCIEETNEKGYEDLCNLSGIPGNLGGWVRGNAGAFGSETQDTIVSVDYIDEYGNLCTKKKEECEFDYRESIFKSHPEWCVVSATMKLTQKADPVEAKAKTKQLAKDRWKKYPPGRSGGSFFKNPEGDFSGRLLEDVGAKGDCIGDICVSDIHANFFINNGGTQKDLIALARKWHNKVKEVHNVSLEPEIFIMDEYGKKVTL